MRANKLLCGYLCRGIWTFELDGVEKHTYSAMQRVGVFFETRSFQAVTVGDEEMAKTTGKKSDLESSVADLSSKAGKATAKARSKMSSPRS